MSLGTLPPCNSCMFTVLAPGLQASSLFHLFPVNITKEVSLLSSFSQGVIILLILFTFFVPFSFPFFPSRILIWQSLCHQAQQNLLHLFKSYFTTVSFCTPSYTIYRFSYIVLCSSNSGIFLKKRFLLSM